MLLVVLVLARSSQPFELARMPLELGVHWYSCTAVYTYKEIVGVVLELLLLSYIEGWCGREGVVCTTMVGVGVHRPLPSRFKRFYGTY